MNRRFTTIVGIVIIWAAAWSLGTTGLPLPSGRGTLLQLPIIVPVALSLLWWGLNGINVVRQWERRPTLLLGGTYWRTKGPGLCFIEPMTVTSLYDVPVLDVVDKFTAPKVQTRNNVSLDIDGVITWCVDEKQVKDAVVNVQTFGKLSWSAQSQ